MSRLNIFKTVSMTLVAVAVGLSLQAQATTINTPLNFFAAPQSMWGPGSGPSIFNYSGSATINWPLGIPSSKFGYSVSASSGTVFGNVNGSFATHYTPVLSVPGVTQIGMTYAGDANGGMLNTLIAAAASLTVFGQTFGPSLGLLVPSTFTPVLVPPGVPEGLGLKVTDIANPSIDAGVGSVGVDMAVVQTTQFSPIGIAGTLFYQREGSSVVQSRPFVDLAASSTLSVNLTQAGTYDFWYGDNWGLLNAFSSSAILGLTASESTFAGCGTVGTEKCNWHQDLVNQTLYDSGSFPLSFKAFGASSKFQIKVSAVPVPRELGLVLLAGGILLIGLLDVRRRRQNHLA